MVGVGTLARASRLRRSRVRAPSRPDRVEPGVRSRAGFLPHVAAAERLPLFFWIAAAMLFAGIYTDLIIPIDRGVIPMVSAFPGAALMYFRRGVISPKAVYFITLPPIAVFLYSTLAPEFVELLPNRLFASAQVAYGLFIGYAASCSLGQIGKERLHSILTLMLPIFLVLILLEIVTPFRQVVTDYLFLYPREFDLDAISNRDGGMGGYRPKLFTSETSYVGVSAFMLLVAYLWSGRGARRYVIFGWYMLAALILIRSPIIVLALPVALATANFDRSMDANRTLYNIGLVVGLLVLCVGIYVFGSAFFAERLQKVSSGDDYSVTYRTYGSFAVALNILDNYPLFGIGPGSLVIVKNTIMSTLIQLGVPISAVDNDWDKSINNAPSSFLIYFGIVGTVAAALISSIIIKKDLGSGKFPAIVALLCYSTTYGAVYTPKFLVTVVVLLMLAKLLVDEGDPDQRRRRPVGVPVKRSPYSRVRGSHGPVR